MKTFQILLICLTLQFGCIDSAMAFNDPTELAQQTDSASLSSPKNTRAKRLEFPIEIRLYPAVYSSMVLSLNMNYRLVPRVWIGVGAGVDVSLSPLFIPLFGTSVNYPVYGALQVYPFRGKHAEFFVYGNGGYSFWSGSNKINGHDMIRKNSGAICEVGIGMHSSFNRRIGGCCRIGYSLRRVNFADGGVYYMNGQKIVDDDSFWRKAFCFGAGIFF